jgi:hypothetical protein
MSNMKMVRKISSQKGQTFVEYILLTAVVIGLFSFFLKLPFMADLMSSESQFSKGLFRSMQYCYRHAIYGEVVETYPTTYQSPNHASYTSGGDTRFFGPADPYP